MRRCSYSPFLVVVLGASNFNTVLYHFAGALQHISVNNYLYSVVRL